MAYLQITTKCNMDCPHCCYSCTMRGKHMNWSTVVDAISFIRNNNEDEQITIGGGEPTLHPRFFDILKICLEDFDYVWMATNGSQTKTMWRLANIINQCDYESFEREDYCSCDEDEENCYCEPHDLIYQENKLTVALSQDYFHSDINETMVDYWEKRARQHRHSGFEIRNVTINPDGIAAQGRAKSTGSGWGEHCVCPDFIIKPNGNIKLCGCEKSPKIGDIWNGISDYWTKKMQNSEKYQDERCYKAFKRK